MGPGARPHVKGVGPGQNLRHGERRADQGKLLRLLQEGDDASQGMTVARVSRSNARRVRAWLVDVDDGKVSRGMPALVTLDAHPDRVFMAVVDLVLADDIARARQDRRQDVAERALLGREAAVTLRHQSKGLDMP